MTSFPLSRAAASGLLLPFVALVAGAVAMGASPIFVRHAAAAEVGPFASAFWRVALALPFLFAWAVREDRGRPSRPTLSKPAILAGLFFTGDLVFWHLSILATTVANATFFATTAPLWVILISWLVFRERISRGMLVGISLCLMGGAALIGNSLAVDPARIRGDAFGLVTAVFFALYFFGVKRSRAHAGPGRATLGATLVTSAALFVVAFVAGDRFIPNSYAGWGALLGMALISQAAGQGLLAVALGRLPTTFSSLVIFLEALAAAAFGWILLGEALAALQAAGGVLILAGICAARPRDGKDAA